MDFLNDPRFVAIISVLLFIISEVLPSFNVKPNSIWQVVIEILKFLGGKKKDKDKVE